MLSTVQKIFLLISRDNGFFMSALTDTAEYFLERNFSVRPWGKKKKKHLLGLWLNTCDCYLFFKVIVICSELM